MERDRRERVKKQNWRTISAGGGRNANKYYYYDYVESLVQGDAHLHDNRLTQWAQRERMKEREKGALL